jgi:hypothetical protein
LAAPQIVQAADPQKFVTPSSFATPRAVWGHRHGIRLGLEPTPGAAGLIRVYAPHLGLPDLRPINYISIEPTAVGEAHRAQSELAKSQWHPGRQGLALFASDSIDTAKPNGSLVDGIANTQENSLSVFVHCEPFENGARIAIQIRFDANTPDRVQFTTYAARGSAPLSQCVLSATMGNYTLQREIVVNGATYRPDELWRHDTSLDALGFLPWRTWPLSAQGKLLTISARTDTRHPMDYAPAVPPQWRYTGPKTEQTWQVENSSSVLAAVNARTRFWSVEAPIPGGASFENVELRRPFVDGEKAWFSISRAT